MDEIKKDSMNSRRHFQLHWKTELHGWLTARKSVAGSEIGVVIERLREFSQLVDNETFEVAAGKILGGAENSDTVLELLEKLANRLSRGLRGTERKIVTRTIQEAFLYATKVQYDLPVSAFGRKFNAFLQRRGSSGLIGLFLRSLVSNEISMRLQVPLRTAPDLRAFESAFEEIDRLCSSAVAPSPDKRITWPKLNHDLARNLIRALESQIGEVAHSTVA